MNNPRIENQISVILLGASFSTGNLGVSALAWSSIKAIIHQWPDARIAFVGAGRKPGKITVKNIGHRQVCIPTWPVRYCANILAHGHITKLWAVIIFCRFFPFLKKRFLKKESTLGELLHADIICDITGGDSFSDIYGLSRFFKSYLLKRICQLTGSDFVLLPQTYGPFQSLPTKIMAGNIFKSTTLIYSRDKEGLDVAKSFSAPSGKLKLCPDMAFILDAIEPEEKQNDQFKRARDKNKTLIGINISGLLYNGGYSQNNMFGLSCDYKSLIKKIIITFANHEDTGILLVPHVHPSDDSAIENDHAASMEVIKNLPAILADNITLLEKGYDQNETKYFIGQCDFFIGARMHATIGALSLGIPAIGLAYSKKFRGVFQTAGVQECIIDLRTLDQNAILDECKKIYERRKSIEAVLKESIPGLKKTILEIFNNLEDNRKQIKNKPSKLV